MITSLRGLCTCIRMHDCTLNNYSVEKGIPEDANLGEEQKVERLQWGGGGEGRNPISNIPVMYGVCVCNTYPGTRLPFKFSTKLQTA